MPKDLPKSLEPAHKEVMDFLKAAKPLHDAHVRTWDRYFALYRAHKQLKDAAASATSANDVDDVQQEVIRTFGANLFIPYVFTIIETILPRMLDTNPRMLILPRKPEWEDNVEPIKLMIDAQQSAIDYPLILQDVGKDGLIYGLGVQKLYWDKRVQQTFKLAPPTARTSGGPEWVEEPTELVLFDGPMAESVDPYDFFWHPLATSGDNLTAAAHRTWRDDRYLAERFKTGDWTLPRGWKLEDVTSKASSDARDKVMQQRLEAAGVGEGQAQSENRGRVHEVIEYHDGSKMIVVVNGCLPVVTSEQNPYWHGELPFQIYRPTVVPHQLVGIGEAEAVEDLQEEMNTLRTQRRDNAAVVLQKPFAYFQGLVRPEDVKFGPAVGIPVDGDPREVLFPIPTGDIPNSGYQEENNLSADIARVSGIDDSMAGSGEGASETATGVQLVQAAANVRIRMKGRRLEQEVVKPAARQWLRLNQQKITTTQDVVGPPKPGEADRSYSWYEVGPEELAGQFSIEPEAGSMEPENKAAKVQNGLQIMSALVNLPSINQQKLIEWALEQFGITPSPEWITPQVPQVPLDALDVVRQALEQLAGTDPDQLVALLHDPQQFDALVEQIANPEGGQQAPAGDQPGAMPPDAQQQDPQQVPAPA